MNGLTRYMLRQLVTGIILVAVALTCVIWLSQSLRFVEMIVNRGLTVGAFIYLTMLLLPNFLSIILPIALFAVVVFTYGRMVTDRELVVMRSAGMSQWALARPAVILALLAMAVGYALNFYLLPVSYQKFRELQWEIRYSYSHILLRDGAFNTVSPEITVYVRQRTKDNQLLGILVHDSREKDKPATIMAERGALVQAEAAPRFVMFNGSRQEVDRKTNRLAILYFDKYTFDMAGVKRGEAVRYREPRERMVDELFDIERDELLNRNDYGKFKVEGHKRLLSPLSNLAFALIGLAALVSGPITRRGQARRVIVAVAIVTALQGLYLGLENFCARRTAFIPAMYVAALLPPVLAFLYLIFPPRPRRPRAGVVVAQAV